MKDLKLKLTLQFLASFALLLLVFSVVVYVNVKHRLFAEAVETLHSHLRHEVSHIPDGSIGEFDSHSDHGKTIFIRVINPYGGEIFSSFPTKYKKSTLEEIGSSGNPVENLRAHINGMPINIEGFYDVSSVRVYLQELRRTLLLYSVLLIIFSAPLGIWFTRLSLKPFKELSVQAAQLNARNLSYRFPKPGAKDEYGVLVSSFNALLDRLEHSFSVTSHFAQNASHELRTPVAVISGHAEVALRKPRTPEEYAGTLTTILQRSRRMERMLEQLLMLSDVHSSQDFSVSEFDGVEVIEEIIEMEKVRNPAARTVSLSHEGESLFTGNLELFKIIVRNLVENAIKYSESDIQICFRHSDAGVELAVENDGQKVGLVDLSRLVEPFERDRSQTQEGHGLGLSIVDACVRKLKGAIDLQPSSLGGLKVLVTIPNYSTSS